ncbi:MAG: Crp/Fnr family transcriptional regulator [Elusimicrobia bacterium]|nr:Crp/Fnr family transcriptional regulator [Elusimicrobiota bacterium]MDE2237093.1 Crp/Fnr family transcriptional regulator [Elusimicrobiota bacterium]MDE2426003.1 Crp/Fnr family transcriptional regulator [Elusimicrobiota bacterium]
MRGRCGLLRWPASLALPRTAADRLCQGWRGNDYRRGDILFYQGNEPQGLYFVCSGRVALSQSAGSGRQQIVRFASGPDVLGERALIAGRPYEATAEAAEDSRICFLDASRFRRLWEGEPALVRALARRLAERLGQVQDLCAELGLRPLRERLARLIARELERAPGSRLADLGASRQQLAKRLGTAPEVVCRALAQLERGGILALEGRVARVLDQRRLRAAACLPAAADDFYQDRAALRSSRRDPDNGQNLKDGKGQRRYPWQGEAR